MGASELSRVRAIARTLPGVNERISHGVPCFFTANEKPVCYYHDDHRGDGQVSLWFPARAGVQEEMVVAEPERFFRPPTSARGTFSDWLGVYLDGTGENAPDWDEIKAIFEDAFRHVVPKRISAEFDPGRRHRARDD